jgi:hypothetical protein
LLLFLVLASAALLAVPHFIGNLNDESLGINIRVLLRDFLPRLFFGRPDFIVMALLDNVKQRAVTRLAPARGVVEVRVVT